MELADSPGSSEKVDLFGVGVSVTDYDDATGRIIEAAREQRSFGVSALAVHGLMEGVNDPEFNQALDKLALVTPDGQPVRWAINALHGCSLSDRVYGPDLTWHVLAAAERERLSIFLFGSEQSVLADFQQEIQRRHPRIVIAGAQADRFREATLEEDAADVESIDNSGADIVLVGRGCPRQERWVSDHVGLIHAPMMAVGAAFDYGAGNKVEPPEILQRLGLQWLWRLYEEPGRLWKRYLTTNSRFLMLFSEAWIRQSFNRAKRRSRRSSNAFGTNA